MKPGRPAVLDNYRLCFPIFSEYWAGGIADIVYDPGKYVAGALFELTEADLAVLDLKVGRKVDGRQGNRDISANRREGIAARARANQFRLSPIKGSTWSATTSRRPSITWIW